MRKRPSDYFTDSTERLRRAEESFLDTFYYGDGLSVKKRSGKYYDVGGTLNSVSAIASPIVSSIVDQAKNTVYEDLVTQRDYNNRSALSGISDNDSLLMAYDNLDWGSTKTGKDFRNGTIFGDISDSLMGGLSAGLSTGNVYVGLGTAAAGLAGNAYKWSKAGDDARKWNEGLTDYREDLSRRFNTVADQVHLSTNRNKLANLYNLSAFGGTLSTHGADWDNGLTYINAGGTHESNPNDGVPAGVDENGTPNLVEEGEVIWDNEYVFSNRLKVPQKLRNKYKLGGPITYADAVKKLTKESEERKNDPISNTTNKAIVNEFIDSQEEVRAKKQQRAAERLQQAQYENELLNAIAGLGAEQAPMGPIDMPMPAQEVPQEAPVIEQMGAYGGNLFEDGGNLFELGGPSGVSLSKEDIEQLKIEREAKEYAKRYLESIGEKPTERKINSIAKDIAYNKNVAINPNGSVKLDYEPDRVRWRSRDNWKLEKYPIVEKTDSTTGASVGGTSTLGEIPADGGMLEEAAVTANQDPNAGRQTPPPPPAQDPNVGRGNGNQRGQGQLYHDRSLTEEQVREFEQQEHYQNFIKWMKSNPEGAKNWIDRLNKGEFGSLNGYTISGINDWEDLATDGLMGYIHRATDSAAKKFAENKSAERSSFGLEKPKNSLEPLLEDYNKEQRQNFDNFLGQRVGRTELDVPDYREFRDVKEPRTPFDWRREAPIIGGALQSILGLAGGPDYTNADAVLSAAERLGSRVNIPVETIGDIIRRRPYDERYMVNLANQNKAAAERGAANTAGGNRAMQLGADAFLAHSNQADLAEIMRQAYLANRQDEFSTAEFNRGTRLQNMSAINSRNLAEAQLNSQRQQAAFNGTLYGRNMRQQIYDRDVATTGANLSNLFNNLSLRGKEAIEDNTIQSLVDNGYFTYSRDPKTGVVTFHPTDKIDVSAFAKHGGKLKKKRRF